MTPLTADEAKDALRRSAHRGDPWRGPTVHRMGSFTGATIELAGALDDVDEAVAAGEPVGWLDGGALGHALRAGRWTYDTSPDAPPLPEPAPGDDPDPAVADVVGWLRDELVNAAMREPARRVGRRRRAHRL